MIQMHKYELNLHISDLLFFQLPVLRCQATPMVTFLNAESNLFYHINCGVIQEFPALRKAVTTHVKKYRISRVLI